MSFSAFVNNVNRSLQEADKNWVMTGRVLCTSRVRKAFNGRYVDAHFVPFAEHVAERSLESKLAVFCGESGSGKSVAALSYLGQQYDTIYVYMLAANFPNWADSYENKAVETDFQALSTALRNFAAADPATFCERERSAAADEVAAGLQRFVHRMNDGDKVRETAQRWTTLVRNENRQTSDASPSPPNEPSMEGKESPRALYLQALETYLCTVYWRNKNAQSALSSEVESLLNMDKETGAEQVKKTEFDEGHCRVVLVVDEIGVFPMLLQALAASHNDICQLMRIRLNVANVSLCVAGTGAAVARHDFNISPNDYEIVSLSGFNLWKELKSKNRYYNALVEAIETSHETWAVVLRDAVRNARVAALVAADTKNRIFDGVNATAALLSLPHLLWRAGRQYRGLNALGSCGPDELGANVQQALALELCGASKGKLFEGDGCETIGLVTDTAKWRPLSLNAAVPQSASYDTICTGSFDDRGTTRTQVLALPTHQRRFVVSKAQKALARWMYGEKLRPLRGDALGEAVVDWLGFLCLLQPSWRLRAALDSVLAAQVRDPNTTLESILQSTFRGKWSDAHFAVYRLRLLLHNYKPLKSHVLLPLPENVQIAPTAEFLKNYKKLQRKVELEWGSVPFIVHNDPPTAFADVVMFVGSMLWLIRAVSVRLSPLTELDHYRELYKMGLRHPRTVCAEAAALGVTLDDSATTKATSVRQQYDTLLGWCAVEDPAKARRVFCKKRTAELERRIHNCLKTDEITLPLLSEYKGNRSSFPVSTETVAELLRTFRARSELCDVHYIMVVNGDAEKPGKLPKNCHFIHLREGTRGALHPIVVPSSSDDIRSGAFQSPAANFSALSDVDDASDTDDASGTDDALDSLNDCEKTPARKTQRLESKRSCSL